MIKRERISTIIDHHRLSSTIMQRLIRALQTFAWWQEKLPVSIYKRIQNCQTLRNYIFVILKDMAPKRDHFYQQEGSLSIGVGRFSLATYTCIKILNHRDKENSG